eukprot:3999733-Pleurochrysis_carterae.AAC.1
MPVAGQWSQSRSTAASAALYSRMTAAGRAALAAPVQARTARRKGVALREGKLSAIGMEEGGRVSSRSDGASVDTGVSTKVGEDWGRARPVVRGMCAPRPRAPAAAALRPL